MGNKNFYGKEAIASNVIPNVSNISPEEEKVDGFGRKIGELRDHNVTGTFNAAEHFLKEFGDKCGVKKDLSLISEKRITVTSSNDSEKKYDVRIIAGMKDGYYDCITGEKIDVENVQCIPGKLEDFFDRKEYGYRYYNGYCAIFFLNKEKWESLKKELTDMLIS